MARRHAMFTGLTSEHDQNCRARSTPIHGGLSAEDDMAQRKKEPRPAPSRRRGGLHRAPSTDRVCTASKPTPPRLGSIWGRRRVLLLNSTYEPLTALPMRRAVVMLLCGKADVVHDDPTGPVIHSATRAIVVPSVIRLRSYVRVPYRARIPMTRAALMHRDRFRCAYCGARPTPSTTWCRAAAAAATPGRTASRAARPATTARPTSCSPNWAGRCGRCRIPPKGQHWRLLSTVKELDPAWVRYLGEGAA